MTDEKKELLKQKARQYCRTYYARNKAECRAKARAHYHKKKFLNRFKPAESTCLNEFKKIYKKTIIIFD